MSGDFTHFTYLAQSTFQTLSRGHLPFGGVYTGLGGLLALLFGLWATLPIAHQPLNSIIGEFYFNPSPEGFVLVFLMKLPTLLFDLLAGVLVFMLVKDATGSAEAGGRAFLLWYLNPFNVFIIEIWGAYDIIPAALLVLSILCCQRGKWSIGGLALSLATIFRIFPILLLPVFLMYAVRKKRAAVTKFAFWFVVPLAVGFAALVSEFGSLYSVIGTFVGIIVTQPWLLRFLGLYISPGTSLSDAPLQLAVFLYPVQFYLMIRAWRGESTSLTNLTLAFLLIHFTASWYEPYHFTWVTPILTAYWAINRQRNWLFALLFISAFASILGYTPLFAHPNVFLLFPTYTETLEYLARSVAAYVPAFLLLEPLSLGIYYGSKASILLKLNLNSLNLFRKVVGKHGVL